MIMENNENSDSPSNNLEQDSQNNVPVDPDALDIS